MIAEDFSSRTTEQRKIIMDKIMEEVRAELDAIRKPGVDIYDDSDEADEAMDQRMREGVRLMLKKMKERGLPIARYDRIAKRSYIEYNGQEYTVEEFSKSDC